MKVFISQPMRKKDDITVKNDRIAIENFIESEIGDFETANPLLNKNDYPYSTERGNLLMLVESIKQLANADIAYFPKVIYQTRGCEIELKCALGYGIRIAFYNPDIIHWKSL